MASGDHTSRGLLQVSPSAGALDWPALEGYAIGADEGSGTHGPVTLASAVDRVRRLRATTEPAEQ
jgi:hypothetical protein